MYMWYTHVPANNLHSKPYVVQASLELPVFLLQLLKCGGFHVYVTKLCCKQDS